MKETLEKLWDEYFSQECAVIDTQKEKELAKKVANLSEAMRELLTEEQSNANQEYVDALCEIQAFFNKKAFLKGCAFATAFLFEAFDFGKA